MYGPLLAGFTILVTSLLAYFHPGILLNTLGSGQEGVFSTAMWKNPFMKKSIHDLADFFISLQADIIIPKIFSGVTSSGGPYILDKATHLTNLTMAAPMYPPLPNYTLSPHLLYPTLHDQGGFSIDTVPFIFWMWSIAVLTALIIAFGFLISENFWLQNQLASVEFFEHILWRLFSITNSEDADSETRLKELIEILQSQGLAQDPHFEDLLSHISYIVGKTKTAHLLNSLTIEVSNSNAQRDAALAAVEDVTAQRDAALVQIDRVKSDLNTAVVDLNYFKDKRDDNLAVIDAVNKKISQLESALEISQSGAIAQANEHVKDLDSLAKETAIIEKAHEERVQFAQQRIQHLEIEVEAKQQQIDSYQDLYVASVTEARESSLPDSDDSNLLKPCDNKISNNIDSDVVEPCGNKTPSTDDSDSVESPKLVDGSVNSPQTSSAGNTSTGNTSTGSTSTGNTSTGSTSTDSISADNTSAGNTSTTSEENPTPVTRRKKVRKGRAEYNAQKLRLRKEEAAYIAEHGTTVHGTPPPASLPSSSALDAAPKADTAPKGNSALETDAASKVDNTPKADAAANSDDAATKTDAVPKQNAAPKPDGAPKPDATPKVDDAASKPNDAAPISDTTPKSDTTSKPNVTPTSDPAPRTDTAPVTKPDAASKSDAAALKIDAGPNSDATLKPDVAPKGDTIPKSDTPKPDATFTPEPAQKPDTAPASKPDADSNPDDATSKPDGAPVLHIGSGSDGTPPRPSSPPFVQPKLKPRLTPIQPPRFTQPTPPSSDRGRGGRGSGRGGQRVRGGDRGRVQQGGIYNGGHVPVSLVRIRKEAEEEAAAAAKKAAEEKQAEA